VIGSDISLAIGGFYLLALFLIAFVVDRRAAAGRAGFVNSPLVYTLSLSVYCTSWTFYGAVGSASRQGLEYLTIYLGPTLVFMAWWLLPRRILKIVKHQQITSIADFISARFGKSTPISVLVTVICVFVVTPYLALQLKAVAASVDALRHQPGVAVGAEDLGGTLFTDTGFWVAVVMAAFVILFGTRNLSADERHPGLVAAIAFESIVKLITLLAIGIFVVFGLNDGVGDLFREAAWNRATEKLYTFEEGFEARWIAITFLSAAAIICLPRQFQVAFVENQNERHLATAAWLFPLYLLLISLFIVPIALAGLNTQPETANPDLFVLSVPLAAGQEYLALLAFIGGLSAATSMVIVACLAISIMISNHLVTPLILRAQLKSGKSSGDISRTILLSRRIAIVAILALGFLYYRSTAASNALASIGLISFVGVAQLLPSLLAAVFWRNASKAGAYAGLVSGFAVWAYTLLVPNFAEAGWGLHPLADFGPWGIVLLKPTALFGLEGWDPLVHALFWSLGVNAAALVLVSVVTRQEPIERLQAALFVDIVERAEREEELALPRSARAEDLLDLATRVLGPERARQIFAEQAARQGRAGRLPLPDPAFIAYVERQLAGGLGAASARLMVSRIAKGEALSVDTVMALLDETQQAIRHSMELERKSEELRRTAEQLREANEKLRQLDEMKDDFLSRVSHELRTPMTSIRSFAELLSDGREMDPARAQRFVTIIDQESRRLTRLLDEILDLSQLERGERSWSPVVFPVDPLLADAAQVMSGLAERQGVALEVRPTAEALPVLADPDRLKQVVINLLSNAIKFNRNAAPRVALWACKGPEGVEIRVADNGPGISGEDRERLFSKFSRGWREDGAGIKGSGLGLAISLNIMRLMGGDLRLERSDSRGSMFLIVLPAAAERLQAAIDPPAEVAGQPG